MDKLLINGKRNGYTPEDCGETLTVGELIKILQDLDEDTPIYLKNDGGYSYGSITNNDIKQCSDEEINEFLTVPRWTK